MSIWGDKAKGKAKAQPPALPAGLIEQHARAAKLEEKQRENPDKDWILVYDQAAESSNYKALEKSMHHNQAQNNTSSNYQSFLKTVGGFLGLGNAQ